MHKISTIIRTIKLLFCWFVIELRCILSLFLKTNKPAQDDKKLAILSFCLPPQFNSGTHRPLSFIKYSKDNNWSVSGVTNPPLSPITKAGEELFLDMPKNTSIVNFSNNLEGTSWHLTPKVDGGFANAIALTLYCLKLYQKDRPTLLLASAPPFYFAIAGMFLSKILNIPLVLDYRDEWTLCPFSFVSKSIFDKFFEQRCIKRAKLIVYTTQSHMTNHRTAFNIPPAKQTLVYNGWEDSFLTKCSEEKTVTPVQPNKIVISYIGKLSGHVDLHGFFNTLKLAIEHNPALANKVIVKVIGEKSPQKASELANYIADKSLNFELVSISQVEKSKALSLMKDSTFLLMLCNQDLATYIPGKLYDYLSMEKRIISFGIEGEVSAIIQSLDMGLHVKENEYNLLASLLSPNQKQLHSNNEALKAWLATRTRSYQASIFFEALNKVNE